MNLKLFSLVVLLLVKILAAPIVYMDFKIHQERLAKVACVERNAPITICRANCVLVNKLQLTTDTPEDEKSLKIEKQQELLFMSALPVFLFCGNAPIPKISSSTGNPCIGFDHRLKKPPKSPFLC
ncbi:hypothetical protein [Echinicola rosea]|uniref:hypothetical protein n=1 Tax=Echinicola rosea TaxID=1807691 RepID=UPI0010CA6C9F|nr:hypothetical protein [Echinicola rosea]